MINWFFLVFKSARLHSPASRGDLRLELLALREANGILSGRFSPDSRRLIGHEVPSKSSRQTISAVHAQLMAVWFGGMLRVPYELKKEIHQKSFQFLELQDWKDRILNETMSSLALNAWNFQVESDSVILLQFSEWLASEEGKTCLLTSPGQVSVKGSKSKQHGTYLKVVLSNIISGSFPNKLKSSKCSLTSSKRCLTQIVRKDPFSCPESS